MFEIENYNPIELSPSAMNELNIRTKTIAQKLLLWKPHIHRSKHMHTYIKYHKTVKLKKLEMVVIVVTQLQTHRKLKVTLWRANKIFYYFFC